MVLKINPRAKRLSPRVYGSFGSLESREILEFHFPGLENHRSLFSVMESYGKLKSCLVDIVTANDKARTK